MSKATSPCRTSSIAMRSGLRGWSAGASGPTLQAGEPAARAAPQLLGAQRSHVDEEETALGRRHLHDRLGRRVGALEGSVRSEILVYHNVSGYLQGNRSVQDKKSWLQAPRLSGWQRLVTRDARDATA